MVPFRKPPIWPKRNSATAVAQRIIPARDDERIEIAGSESISRETLGLLLGLAGVVILGGTSRRAVQGRILAAWKRPVARPFPY